MDSVQFSEDEIARPRAVSAPTESKAARWLVARGMARTDKEANMMLLGMAALIAAVAIIVFLLSLGGESAPPVTDAERLRNELSTPMPRQ